MYWRLTCKQRHVVGRGVDDLVLEIGGIFERRCVDGVEPIAQILERNGHGVSPYFGAGDVQPEQPVHALVHDPLQPDPQEEEHAALQLPPHPPVQFPEQPEQLPVQLPTHVLVQVPEQPVQDWEQPDEQFQLQVPPQSKPALL